MKNIPNFITSLNLVSGFIAIIFAASGKIDSASWFILAAMIFDFLDGLSARLLKAHSAIGKELDSLADVVSFGVAPALIIFQLLGDSISLNSSLTGSPDILKLLMFMIISAIMPVCAALRLAIFNLDLSQITTFKGLPTPANGFAVISVVIAGSFSQSPVLHSFISSPLLLVLYTLSLSLLMVSRIPMLSLKISNLKLKGNEGRYILAGLVFVAIVIFGTGALPLIIPLYIISSVLSLLF